MIPAIVLAAGASIRMGRPKALLPLDNAGRTFVSAVVSTLHAAGLDDVIVVIGPDADVAAIDRAIGRTWPRVRTVINPVAAGGGQLSSILTGLEAADRPGVRGLLVTLVDIPLVSAATIRAVVDAYESSHAAIVRPSMSGRHGHPVIFDRRMFEELRDADPSEGAKAVLRQHARDIHDVEVDDRGAFIDIDTPDDYRISVGRTFGRLSEPEADT